MSAYLREMFGLDGRVALVTGGSTGIGFAMAEALGRAGARVAIVARQPEGLAAAVQQLEAAGVTARAVSADLADRSQVARAADEAVAAVGEPDILVCAAGVNPRPHMDELSADDWDLCMRVNVDAAFLLGQRFGPGMAERGWGRVINVGSQQAHRAFGNSGAYGVSKAAITGLTRSQAEAWSGRGVCCHTVVPGFVLTRLGHVHVASGRADALAARTMVGRNGLPQDFAGTTVFLASAASSYLTGQEIYVDGGFSVT
ncbi:MAG TPA: SDR family oxidoreductase [Stackebrandtia sp.]|uniref:SDR family NAD(P)-dependent oxidoreductase n=1 Tax=Stackebrandtia sp. TaxID=2023065 RepID=UPI002D6ADBF7|nr:SDR family oxidoreductase [Stackebrandtia sp.]HZE41562.1 SDR family oxidoreductase [Stackebrandtia sp.]